MYVMCVRVYTINMCVCNTHTPTPTHTHTHTSGVHAEARALADTDSVKPSLWNRRLALQHRVGGVGGVGGWLQSILNAHTMCVCVCVCLCVCVCVCVCTYMRIQCSRAAGCEIFFFGGYLFGDVWQQACVLHPWNLLWKFLRRTFVMSANFWIFGMKLWTWIQVQFRLAWVGGRVSSTVSKET